MISSDPGAERLKGLAEAGGPGLQVILLLRLYEEGSISCIPDLWSWSNDGTRARSPWLKPVVRRIRDLFSCEAICNGARRGDAQALKAAVAAGHRHAVEGILSALQDPTLDRSGSSRRADLCWTLGEIRDRRAIPSLLRELAGGDYRSRADAAEALGKIGDPSLLPDLIAAVEGSTAWTQVHLFGAIGRLGSEDEIPLLEKYAESREYTGAISRAECAKRAIHEIRNRCGH